MEKAHNGNWITAIVSTIIVDYLLFKLKRGIYITLIFFAQELIIKK